VNAVEVIEVVEEIVLVVVIVVFELVVMELVLAVLMVEVVVRTSVEDVLAVSLMDDLCKVLELGELEDVAVVELVEKEEFPDAEIKLVVPVIVDVPLPDRYTDEVLAP
jgi:hypothetical protein